LKIAESLKNWFVAQQVKKKLLLQEILLQSYVPTLLSVAEVTNYEKTPTTNKIKQKSQATAKRKMKPARFIDAVERELENTHR
jgi:hypothetical protein